MDELLESGHFEGKAYYNGIHFNFIKDGNKLYINLINARAAKEDLDYILSIAYNKEWVLRQIPNFFRCLKFLEGLNGRHIEDTSDIKNLINGKECEGFNVTDVTIESIGRREIVKIRTYAVGFNNRKFINITTRNKARY